MTPVLAFNLFIPVTVILAAVAGWLYLRLRVSYAQHQRDVAEVRKESQMRGQNELRLQEALKSAETAASQARSEAEAADLANRAKSTFLSTMSHEIRTPLNAILGLTDVALTGDLNAEQRECLETIKKSGTSLLAIIGNILDYSKIESGVLDLKPEQFNLVELIEEIESLFRHSAKSKGLHFRCALEGEKALLVTLDRQRLRQILLNLVSNAIKFTEKGEVQLKVTREVIKDGSDTKPGVIMSRLLFHIIDTGVGLSEEHQNELFTPFHQADGSYTRKHGGTGLGLAIVKRITESMDGTVEVKSTLGQGTTFIVGLTAETIPLQARAAPPKTTTTTTLYKSPLAQSFYTHDILVVEDDPNNRKVMTLILKKMGHQAVFAENGRMALDVLSNSRPDLVLMDVEMPIMDGVEATKRIRRGEAGEDNRNIPIVALTAFAVSTDRERFLASGMDFYISKPVSPEVLREVLTKIARQKGK